MNQTSDTLTVGQRVTVTQQVQLKGWTLAVTGIIEALEQRKTGSWFAHSKDDRLWLDRLILRKDDGEIVVCNLDRYSRVEVEGRGVVLVGAGITQPGSAGAADKAPIEPMAVRGSMPDANDEVRS